MLSQSFPCRSYTGLLHFGDWAVISRVTQAKKILLIVFLNIFLALPAVIVAASKVHAVTFPIRLELKFKTLHSIWIPYGCHFQTV